jgi:hypothetical protein
MTGNRGRAAALCFLALLLLGLSGWGDALGQCVLANPSFEISGSVGEVFGGWGEFGTFGSSANATHGSRAAVLTGPNTGDWGFSGYWQALASAPGERWSASGLTWHSSANPLTGESAAFIGIEWRDAGWNLISSESHVAADATALPDQIQAFSVESGPAPAGTA